ncbi:MAG TPA: oxidoreductase [Polyangiaceae bacterium LLY-WYZ-15_(1-7)]|nr:oxidoreductase [Polyangiaceae bacterium LLY-WYZ-15_(1-7)]
MHDGKWTHANIGDQSGKVAIVTGANSGIGYETAKALAEKGATVVLACRSAERGEGAVARIREAAPDADVRFMALDLADLEEVAAFADAFREAFDRLDLLINNAGVMMPPLTRTAQGFELQIGVNHLGHFALTGRLLELVLATPGARVVTVSSIAHKQGKLDLADLSWETRSYGKVAAYAQSKLANLLFTFELQRRLEAAGAGALALAAHPGWTGTELQRHVKLFELANHVFAMPQPQGALPTLRAVTDPAAEGGDYYGPHAFFEWRGYPVKVGCTKAARDEADAAALWEKSVALTGVDFGALARARAA